MAVLGLLAALGPALPDEPRTIVVFDFELVDTSQGGAVPGEGGPAERARLELIADEVRQQLEAADDFTTIEIESARDAIAGAGYLRQCNGCELRIAGDLGADLALVGWVQKVSNLILNINLRISDVQTGDVVFLQSADIRGNTDESWLRGIRWLLRNRLFAEPA